MLLTVFVCRLYAALSADESPVLPYSRDIADQRHTYGNNLLRRADESLQKQREYENTINAEHESTRRMLQEKRERKEAEMVSGVKALSSRTRS